MQKLLLANWKAQKTRTTAEEWLTTALPSLAAYAQAVEISIAPPFPLVPFVAQQLAHSALRLAVQDVSPYPPGKYTGAVAAAQLTEFSVRYALVGHSERRRYFHETHNDVANKVAQCLEVGITPIVCVDDEYITAQAAALSSDHIDQCVVAYEALSAIGTGAAIAPEHVQQISARIKDVFSSQTRVLYGGSVTGENILDYASCTEGWLVGTASLDPAEFITLARRVSLS